MKRYDLAIYNGRAVMEPYEHGEWIRADDAHKRITKLERERDIILDEFRKAVGTDHYVDRIIPRIDLRLQSEETR